MIRPGRMIQQVLGSLFKKPATSNYPFVKVEMPDKYRGQIIFHPEKCICCKLCMRDCPSDAIVIKKVGEKQFVAEFNLAKCIYCAQCVYSCPKDALESTKNFELANIKPGDLKVTFSADPIDAAQNKT